jgi:hypothetical protein
LAKQLDVHDTFFRGQELVVVDPVSIQIESPAGDPISLRIANVAALLAMKIQAFDDHPTKRRRDAFDIAFLLRHGPRQAIAQQLANLAKGEHAAVVARIIDRLKIEFCDSWSRGTSAAYDEQHGGPTPWAPDEEDAERAVICAAVLEVVDLADKCR